ncbi:MAG: hypothetical protein ACI33P_11280 [Lysinibacillus sp.]
MIGIIALIILFVLLFDGHTIKKAKRGADKTEQRHTEDGKGSLVAVVGTKEVVSPYFTGAQ